ncbi:hypothetical protein OESDEN_16567 [Oesophagostomum dentatum]|uniref:ISXO2-like transposase domain-containing protein n=1 Tax=Oesophagostomum dentatum TaxID=61180 RepID=A0A0B1SIM3_OESDE|nr:hypothetical protein OESDEN_16567 [Oesophagostomum dentatum]
MSAFRTFALPRLEEELRDFTPADVFEKLKMEDQVFEGWLRSIDGNAGLDQQETAPTFNITKDCFFSKAKISLFKIFATSYFWLHDIGFVEDKEYELGVGHTSVTQWGQYFRDICCEYFRRNWPVLDGFGQVVEVDKTFVTKRKYNRGRWVRKTPVAFRKLRKGEWPMMPGHSCALPQDYTHLTVNHQGNFVDPGSSAHTQNIEFRNMAKRKCGINNRRYRDYLSEFIWKEMFGKGEELLYNLLKQVAELYPFQWWKSSMTQRPSLGPH